MKASNAKILIVILIIGLLSACGTQPTKMPASQPTEAVAPVISSPVSTDPPANTTVIPTDTAPAPAVQTGTVSFANDILPILQSRCINCHGGDRVEEGLNMKSYSGIMTGSDNGAVITAGDPANSLLVELVSTQKMPKKGPKLTPPQIQLIIDWVTQGALDN